MPRLLTSIRKYVFFIQFEEIGTRGGNHDERNSGLVLIEELSFYSCIDVLQNKKPSSKQVFFNEANPEFLSSYLLYTLSSIKSRSYDARGQELELYSHVYAVKRLWSSLYLL